VTYTTEDGLPDPTVNDLLETRSGEYWIATNGGGLCRFDPREEAEARRRREAPGEGGALCTVVRVGTDHRTNRVNQLLEDAAGRIWVATDGGLFVGDRNPDGASFERVPLDLRAGDESTGVSRLSEAPDGSLRIVAHRLRIRRLPDGRMPSYRIDSERRLPVRALLVDPNGTLWVGYAGGWPASGRSPSRS
jgi:ligand-binding sensor domain-containing protein